MEREEIDIFLAGAGPAGLIAAATFAAEGFRVLVADPGPKPGPAGRGDLRSTAFLRPAQALFERIGLWPALAPLATPLDGLRIVDLAGEPPTVRTERLFAQASAGPLGWNFMNDSLRGAVLAHLERQPGVEIAWGCGFAALVNRSTEVLIRLTDGRRLRARLAVAADGRASPMRDAAGIELSVTRYGQKALAFAVSHPVPHDRISTELYLDGGPFTMVPLPDAGGVPASAVVWMNPGPRATELAALPPEPFAAEATRRSGGLLGPLELLTERALWPVVSQRARALTSGRVALIAEAAHVLPPIGAQGLNTSVMDIAALAQSMAGQPDPGAAAVLARFEASRSRDIAARAIAIDLFNRVTRSPDRLAQELRQIGLKLVHDVAPIRRGLIRAGMGPPGQDA
ncbi:FAD-dependent monooxygenase [Frigidibacter sp. ROC022]|uniref:FAD-dependent monooxygenase n=1 Tax=Frigidibacter sp. ROC022 TaxID=2971796 RepID=UPI00215A8A41|nr:FAD-dependent monooxygenase [Frigidibacter sp. ROC022]MCR8725262.1 FAD-dependent monooxygenase [Frigidibacter sp. ROC022]